MHDAWPIAAADVFDKATVRRAPGKALPKLTRSRFRELQLHTTTSDHMAMQTDASQGTRQSAFSFT